MSEGKRNMEEFLREKLNDLETDFQNDWDVFEQKLERALFFKRLRVGAALAVFLIATSIGIFGTSSILSFHQYPEVSFGIFDENGYQSTGGQSEWKPAEAEGQEIALEDIAHAGTVNKAQNSKGEESDGIQDLNPNKGSYTHTVAADQVSDPLTGQEPMITQGISKKMPDKEQLTDENNTPPEEEMVMASGVSGSSATKEITSTKASAIKVQTPPVEKSTTEGSDVTHTASVNQENIPPSEGNSSGKKETTGEPGYTSLEEYQLHKDEPINTKTMKLELQPLSAIAGEGALAGLQVRMSAPSFKAQAKPSGPYISPLEEKSPWEFSIKVYPNFTFRKFKVDEDKANLIHRDFIDQVRVSESGGFSLNIGFEVSRRIGPATYLNSGLEYISYKTSAHFDFINYRTANIDPNTGAIMSYTLMDEPEGIVINDQNTYHYINLPFSIAYKPWASEHIRLNMEAGVSYMHFVAARGRSIDYRTLEIIDLSDRTFRSSMGSLNLRVGATYYISPQFNLGFEPTFVYFTNTIYTEEYPFEVIPYSVGLNLKLQVKLN